MKFGIVYYWRDPVEIFELAQDFLELRIFEDDIVNEYSNWKARLDVMMKDWDGDITIHMPEYFINPITGRPSLIDLASTDDRIYNFSLDIMKNLIGFSNTISAAKLVIHPGGISPKGSERESKLMLELLKNSLIELYHMEFNGDILLENMPWFYWMNDGSRWTSNICIKTEDFEMLLDYCDGMVLDLSHCYLSSSTGSDKMLIEFASKFKSYIHYLHVSDALPPDNEGLQVGEGNIDFSGIFNMLEKEKLWIVPEIWKGHENFGEGFQTALERINHLI